MKRSVITFLLVAAGLASAGSLSSCMLHCVHGSGHQATETRKVTADFTKIDISGGFKVILKQDSSQTISITADDNILKYIKTKNDGGTLHIGNHKNICDGGDMTVTIGVKNLDELRASGATDITAQGKLVCKDMAFHISGMSKIDLNLNAANVTVESSGTGEVTLHGQASSNHVETSGMIQLHAFDFVVSDYDISTSGASSCELNVLHALHVSSSGSSDIKYKGNPTDVTNDKSGASSLEKVQ